MSFPKILHYFIVLVKNPSDSSSKNLSKHILLKDDEKFPELCKTWLPSNGILASLANFSEIFWLPVFFFGEKCDSFAYEIFICKFDDTWDSSGNEAWNMTSSGTRFMTDFENTYNYCLGLNVSHKSVSYKKQVILWNLYKILKVLNFTLYTFHSVIVKLAYNF